MLKTQNSQVLGRYLPEKEIFQVSGQTRPVASSSCRFSFSAARNAITKAAEYVTFGFSFRILIFFPL